MIAVAGWKVWEVEGVKAALTGEVAKLRAKFAAMGDDVLKAKFSQIMRDAIGLKS
mgnify:CR=1 FL=1